MHGRIHWGLRHLVWTTLASAAAICGCGKAADDSPELPLPTSTPVPTAQSDRLELNLKVGDRFPLKKTVSHELQQASIVGAAQSRSSLELLLTITVEEIEPTRKRLGVRYNRVRYSQDVAGEAFDFDSSVVNGPIPRPALPYAGLIGNGFSFWIGEDNQIQEPVGFSEFLVRCVRDVPADERQAVLQQFTQTTTDEGIANFVDDSIGLLPRASELRDEGKAVAEGDTWRRERRLMHPVPIYLKSRYTLRALTKGTAEIDIMGNVSPATTNDSASPPAIVQAGATSDPKKKPDSKTPQVVVRGGKAYGSCTIDRATGLPLNSHVERTLDMMVRLPNGLAFEQRKLTTTTVQAFPQQVAAGPGDMKNSVKQLNPPVSSDFATGANIAPTERR